MKNTSGSTFLTSMAVLWLHGRMTFFAQSTHSKALAGDGAHGYDSHSNNSGKKFLLLFSQNFLFLLNYFKIEKTKVKLL